MQCQLAKLAGAIATAAGGVRGESAGNPGERSGDAGVRRWGDSSERDLQGHGTAHTRSGRRHW